jgi:3-oxoacyl-[acyl-carrier protein] reductase
MRRSALESQVATARTDSEELIMDLGLAGKAALVTGAGRGIGAAIARELARDGCDVALVELGEFGAAETLAAELRDGGRRAIAFHADVTDLAAAERNIAATCEAFGRLDIVVTNAGITRDAPSWKMTEEQWDDVLDVNLKGTFAYCRAAAPVLRAQKSGRIVTIASVNGMRGKFGQVNYSASKAGVVALTRSLARELGPSNVTVNCVAPGMIRTHMTASLPQEIVDRAVKESALGRIGEPEDVAQMVAFLCSERARHVTGEVVRVDGGQLM